MSVRGVINSSWAQAWRVLSVTVAAVMMCSSLPAAVFAVPSSSQLLAHWNYDQSSGTVLNDVSGNARNGTLSSTPTWTAGQFGNALAFDGTDNVSVGNVTAINNVAKVTLATWMKRNAAGAKVLIGKQTTNQDLAIEAWSDGKIYFQMSRGSDTYGTLSLNDTAWHHVALVYDGALTGNANRLKAYVDGVQKTLTFKGTVPTLTTSNTTPFNIGKVGGDYSNGLVDDTWLYARALTAAEVQELRLLNADTVAPSVPAGLNATVASQSQINLSWAAATDNTGVTGYRLYRNGVERATTASLAYQDTGLTANTTYSYTVRAYDAAGNQSADSSPATATTPAPQPAPTATISATPTSVPTGGSSTLQWSSTDATSCTASGAWSGAKVTSGNEQITAITTPGTYTLVCAGPGGQATTSTSITLLPQCMDQLDNDGDGFIDLADIGCANASDNDERDPDVTAPTIGLTAPQAGASVSGTVVLSADSTDNVAVAGVKFYVNGSQVGSEDVTAPYSASWNTTTLTNGSAQLTAVARDAAGNTATSSAVNVTIDNPVFAGYKYVTGVSANGRYFVDQTGLPILIKGDSPWSMFSDMSPAEVELWAANRESHGFNAAIVSLVGSATNGASSNSGVTYDGVLPFTSGNVTAWNEQYWSRMDTYLTSLKNHGITAYLYPMDGWNTLPGALFYGKSNADCYTYGRMVATRYASYPNIVWMAGGDYNGYDPDTNLHFQNMLSGIRSTGDTRLFSIQLNTETLSTDVATYEPLAQWNFAYTYSTVYQTVLRGYNRASSARDPRPVVLSESNYENENNNDGPMTTNETLRRQQLWALTSGSVGEFTGSSDWLFNPGWQNRLDTAWITQAQKNRALFESLSWQLLVPDEASPVVTAGRGTKITSGSSLDPLQNDYVTAAQTPDKSQTVVYVPTNVGNTNARTITLDRSRLPATFNAVWVDPTDATKSVTADVDAAGQVTTPGLHTDGTRDWLLVVRAS